MKTLDQLNIYVCGGAVRDILLGIEPSDIDYVVVGSTPIEMKSLGLTQVGADFPVFLNKVGDEYALARTERKRGNGYLGFDVDFDSSISVEDDLYRRDLTINSMAVRLEDWDEFKLTKHSTLVVDPYGGIDDVRDNILKHTSEYFIDDPVRLLRIARFSAKYQFRIAHQTKTLMKRMVLNGELDFLVPERVWAECKKAIMTQDAMQFFWVLRSCGALDIIIPGISSKLPDIGLNVKSAAIRNCDFMVRSMLLFSYVDDPAKLLLTLKAPSNIIRGVQLFKEATSVVHPSQILQFLHKIHDVNILYTISTALSIVSHQDNLRFDRVIRSAVAIKNIGFHSLTQNQQQTLVGVDIGKAINDIKMSAIEYIK